MTYGLRFWAAVVTVPALVGALYRGTPWIEIVLAIWVFVIWWEARKERRAREAERREES